MYHSPWNIETECTTVPGTLSIVLWSSDKSQHQHNILKIKGPGSAQSTVICSRISTYALNHNRKLCRTFGDVTTEDVGALARTYHEHLLGGLKDEENNKPVTYTPAEAYQYTNWLFYSTFGPLSLTHLGSLIYQYNKGQRAYQLSSARLAREAALSPETERLRTTS
jgi:hypothetical protein